MAHVEHDLTIVGQEGYPRCHMCGLTGPSVDTDSHRNTQKCGLLSARYQDLKRYYAEAESREVKFYVDGEEIDRVDHFKYLGRVVSDDDDDSLAIEANLKKAKAKWAIFKKLLTRETASRRVMGYFYKAIVQSVLLYGAETWVLRPAHLRKLRSFHRNAARYLTKRFIRPLNDGTNEWEYPESASVLEEAGLHDIEAYIQRRRDTIHGFVRGRDSYRTCRDLVSDGEATHYWWNQSFSFSGNSTFNLIT